VFLLMLAPRLAGSADAAGDPRAGQALYLRVGCYECHGTVGQGGIAGARIVPLPLPWLGFRVYVRRPAGQMPAFSDQVLSDAELADIFAFLATVPQGRGPGDIPLLEARAPVTSLKNGKDVYAAVCASCHDGGIGGAPKIRDKAAWSARLAEGMGLLYLHSLKGYTGKFGVMPARGGRADLPTELVKQGVDYMVSVSN
jgi:cytochrome c5